jgi:hypothetical protein
MYIFTISVRYLPYLNILSKTDYITGLSRRSCQQKREHAAEKPLEQLILCTFCSTAGYYFYADWSIGQIPWIFAFFGKNQLTNRSGRCILHVYLIT